MLNKIYHLAYSVASLAAIALAYFNSGDSGYWIAVSIFIGAWRIGIAITEGK